MNTPATSPLLAAALDYVRRGWALLPLHRVMEDGLCTCRQRSCTSPGKHPVAQLVPNGLKSATTNERAVNDWWGRHDWNIGIATGEPSGIVVLDVDPRHDGVESIRKLLADHGDFKATLTAKTGSGGFHFLFRHPGYPVRNSAGQIAPGLDVRGDGGYIVAAPSNHVSGTYSWVNADAPLLPTPHWLGAPDTSRAMQASGPAVIGPVIRHGTQHHTLVSLAGTMRRRGCTADEIEALLLKVNERCERPGPPANIRDIAVSIERYAPDQAVDIGAPEIEAAEGQPQGMERMGDVVAREYERLAEIIQNGHSAVGLSTGFRELDMMTGGLQPGELWGIAARPSHGKSSFAFGMALSLALNGSTVGVFSVEMSKSAVARRFLAARSGIDSMRFRLGTLQASELPDVAAACGELYDAPLYIDDGSRVTVDSIRRLLSGLELPPAAVFVDYLQLVQGTTGRRKFNREDEEIAAVSSGLKGVAKEFNVPVVVVVQLNRDLEKRPGEEKRPRLPDLRGSGQIEQDLDVCLMMWMPEKYGLDSISRGLGSVDCRGMAEVLIRKHREAAQGGFLLRFDPTTVQFREEATTLSTNGHATRYEREEAPF